MRKLFVLALVGLASQLVDGALGMGYGVTSSSLLLLAGLSPALTSASVHLSEIGTTLISGAAHHRLGNTDWRLVARLGGPGAVGALLGAGALSGLSANAAAPVTSGILLALGVYVLSMIVGILWWLFAILIGTGAASIDPYFNSGSSVMLVLGILLGWIPGVIIVLGTRMISEFVLSSLKTQRAAEDILKRLESQ